MTEQEFDELDQAVNKFRDNSVAPAEPTPEPEAKPERSVARPPARRGRFMDIKPRSRPAPKAVSERQPSPPPVHDTTIQPPVRPEPAAEAPAEPVPPAPTPDPAVPEPATEPADLSSAMHQVLQTEPASESPDTPASLDDTEDELDKLIDSVTGDDSDEDGSMLDNLIDESLSSPFLPGAKPEKRPLGANSDYSPPAGDVPFSDPAAFAAEIAGGAEQLEGEHSDSDIVSRVPAELNPTLTAIEADTTGPSGDNATPKLDSGGAITPQYQAGESSTDKSSAPIFDTSEYSKSKPGAQKSSVKWIIIGAVFVVIGIAAGASAFLFSR